MIRRGGRVEEPRGADSSAEAYLASAGIAAAVLLAGSLAVIGWGASPAGAANQAVTGYDQEEAFAFCFRAFVPETAGGCEQAMRECVAAPLQLAMDGNGVIDTREGRKIASGCEADVRRRAKPVVRTWPE